MGISWIIRYWISLMHSVTMKFTFGRVENFKYLGVILSEGNNHQIELLEIIKMLIKHTSCYKNFLEIKIYLKN